MAYVIGLETSGSHLQAMLVENGVPKRYIKHESQVPLGQKLREVMDRAQQYMTLPSTIVAAIPPEYGFAERKRMVAEAGEAGLTLRPVNSLVLAALKVLRPQAEQSALICELSKNLFSFVLVTWENDILEVLLSAQEPLSNATPPAGQIKQAICRGINEFTRLGKIDTLLLGGTVFSVPSVADAVKAACGQGTVKQFDLPTDAAVGAALYSGQLEGILPDIPLILDVTPATLGIETAGGVFTPLIKRNESYPTYRSQTFATSADDQTAVEVRVAEDERVGGRKTLGIFEFKGITPGPAGASQIEVRLGIDPGCNVNVTAKDMRSGKELTPVPHSDGQTVPAEQEKRAEPDREEIVRKFLPVYDSLVRALDCCDRNDPHRKGLEMTLRELTEAFAFLGAEIYAKPGEVFDPNAHTAADHIQSSWFGRNTISKVISHGVRLKGKIIRFATVQVAN